MAARRRSLVRIVLAWAFLTLAWCAGWIEWARAQTPGCYVIDRYQMLCLPSTGEIFVDVAGNQPALPMREPVPSMANVSGTSLPALLAPTVFTAMRRSAATPSIILAHQKLASDAWIDKERSLSGELCCYAGRDCHPVPAEHVKPHPKGVQLSELYNSLIIPHAQIQVSKDGQYWLCSNPNRVRCFFAPYSGS